MANWQDAVTKLCRERNPEITEEELSVIFFKVHEETLDYIGWNPDEAVDPFLNELGQEFPIFLRDVFFEKL